MSSRIVPGGEFKLIQTEVTSRELERRFGTTGVYYRLSVVPSLAAATEMTQEIVGVISAHTSDYLQNPVTDRLLDQVAKTRSRASRFTLRSMSETTAPPKVSMAGLPPLSPYFVQREVPMNHMDVALLGSEEEMRQRVSIITGMGGSGKTQLVVAWARLHAECFQHILFIDASSDRSIETDLVARLKSIDRSFQGTDLSSALQALAEPNEVTTTKWCLILDNADDPDLDITSVLPTCDHGAIIITSRNAQLEFISPEGHIALELMSKSEACDALLNSALGPAEKRTSRQREQAMAIVKEFEYLPIAVIQAGCYIRKHKCLETYLKRLETSRSELLKQTTVQRDKLRYKHSVYAAFDTSLSSLSERALGLLSILCFFHYTGFPRSMIGLAASKGFSHEEYKLMDRSPDFQESIDLLRRLIVPTGKFEEIELDRVLEELLQLSLITLVSLYSDIRLRFHPLLHAWAYDRQSAEERRRNMVAALRLLTCVVDEGDGIDIEQELFPHARRFISEIDTLHINDRAALVELSDPSLAAATSLTTWERIHETVRAAYGDLDIRTSEALLKVAIAQMTIPDYTRMESLSRQVLELRKSVSGPRTASTAEAMFWLAECLRLTMKNHEEMLNLLHLAYSIQEEVLGPSHAKTQKTMFILAYNLMKSSKDPKYDEASVILERLMETQTRLYGPLHPWTLNTTNSLLDCYATMGEKKKGQLNQLLQIRHEIGNPDGNHDIALLSFQAHIYELQGKYPEAEGAYQEAIKAGSRLYGEFSIRNLTTVLTFSAFLWKLHKNIELESLLRKYAKASDELRGAVHYQLLQILVMLGSSLTFQEKYNEAQTLLSTTLAKVIEEFGELHALAADIRILLASCYFKQECYPEAEQLFRENLKYFKEALEEGNAGESYSLIGVAKCVFEQKRFEESEELWREIYLQRKRTLGPNHPAVCWSFCFIIESLQMRDLFDAATPHISEVMQLYRDLEGGTQREILEAYWKVGKALERQRMLTEAEEVFRAHLDRIKEFEGDSGPEYARELGNLAKVLFDQGRYDESKTIREDQMRRWSELQDKEGQEFISEKLRQIEEALSSQPSVDA
ncbi:hypothetical protein PIIN_10344 [Serendipita indica DSM 11827]|uniref:Uncharacterized protein n=1 Tax=Serendipita indica (strain DSM 11827) TaxID=1109443 RepID=G4TYF6_SERID|nr:hypothetical protein PIIN_10344 [Serendipita indica DSM 11827]